MSVNDTVVRSDDGPVAVFTLNRPDSFNALSDELLITLAAKLRGVAGERAVRAVVLTGAGKAFCSGGDLKLLHAAGDERGSAVHQLAGVFHDAVIEMQRMDKPVIAAINGVAAGGGFSLALACDLRVLDRSARMRLAYTAGGLSIDGGGTWNLPRLVGFSKAMEIGLTDPMMDAETAHGIGLAHRLADEGQALANATAWAHELAQLSPQTVAHSKRLLYAAHTRSYEAQLEDERRTLAAVLSGENGREALASFTEKRKPSWKL